MRCSRTDSTLPRANTGIIDVGDDCRRVCAEVLRTVVLLRSERDASRPCNAATHRLAMQRCDNRFGICPKRIHAAVARV